MDNGDVKNFSKYYARYKTENTHFKYATKSRSLTEQTRGGKMLAGLVVFSRGYFDILNRTIAKPISRGVKNGDLLQIYQGIMSSVSLFVGMRMMQEFAKMFMGKRYRDDYDLVNTLLSYDLLSVGAQKAQEFYQDFTKAVPAIVGKYGFTEEALDKIGALISNDLVEEYFPLIDIYVSTYEATGNKAGAKLWTVIRSQLDKRYLAIHGRKFDYADRDTLQKIQHILFGGEERPDVQKPFGEMSSYEKFLRIGFGRRAVYQ